jgi:hypothetical protein
LDYYIHPAVRDSSDGLEYRLQAALRDSTDAAGRVSPPPRLKIREDPPDQRSIPASQKMRRVSASTAVLLLVTILELPLSSCRRIVLDERFYDNRLDNWTVIDDPDTVEGPSVWQVSSDRWLHQSSNIWGRRGDFIGRWYGTSLVAGDPAWRNYTLTVRTKPADNDGFGVLFRFRDSEHFYRLLLIEDGMNGGPLTRLDKRNGPDYTEIWSAKRGYPVGVETDISVSVSGDHIQIGLDASPAVDVRDGSYSAGKIGLFCYAQAGQAFTDVKVVLE